MSIIRDFIIFCATGIQEKTPMSFKLIILLQWVQDAMFELTLRKNAKPHIVVQRLCTFQKMWVLKNWETCRPTSRPTSTKYLQRSRHLLQWACGYFVLGLCTFWDTMWYKNEVSEELRVLPFTADHFKTWIYQQNNVYLIWY